MINLDIVKEGVLLMNRKSLVFGFTIILFSMISAYISSSYALADTNYPIHSQNVDYQDNYNLGVDNVQAAIDGTCSKIDNRLDTLENNVLTLDKIYPVGSIYISTSLSSAAQVANALGGTWVSYGSGRTLVGVDSSQTDYSTVSKTGGTKTVRLSTSNIPSISVTGTTSSTGNGYSIGHAGEWRTTTANGLHTHSFSEGGAALVASSNTTAVGYAQGFSYTTNGGWWTNLNKTASYIANDGNHAHSSLDYYANSISGVEAHTHSFTGTYTNSSQTSVTVQDPYITVYMYQRTA